MPIRCPIAGCGLDSSSVVDEKLIFTAFPPEKIDRERIVTIRIFDHRFPDGEECPPTDPNRCAGSGYPVTLGYMS